LRGDEVTWAQISDVARTPSLFVERRAVVVRGADGVKGSDDEILRYLEQPVEGVLLALVAAKVDKRRRLWARIDKLRAMISAAPLKGQALRGYVADEIRRRKLSLPAEALGELIEHLGSDLRRLMGELDKLEAFAEGRGALAWDDISAVLGPGLGRPVYRLGDAVVARDAALALELTQEMLEEGGEAPYLVGVLFRAVSQMRAVRALREAGVPGGEICRRLRFPPFKLDQVLGAAARWSEAELGGALETLARADRRLKRGADARVILTTTLVRICQPATAAAFSRTEGTRRPATAGKGRPPSAGRATRSRAGR
jgi:DNA polymerase-3 subunit delta